MKCQTVSTEKLNSLLRIVLQDLKPTSDAFDRHRPKSANIVENDKIKKYGLALYH